MKTGFGYKEVLPAKHYGKTNNFLIIMKKPTTFLGPSKVFVWLYFSDTIRMHTSTENGWKLFPSTPTVTLYAL